MNNNKNLYTKLIPVMLCFFAMGFTVTWWGLRRTM